MFTASKAFNKVEAQGGKLKTRINMKVTVGNSRVLLEKGKCILKGLIQSLRESIEYWLILFFSLEFT